MNSFIKKLVEEGKIKLVEPSEDISSSYLQKSDKSLVSSKTLLEIGNLDDAIALTYYSMYYCTLGLFFKCGIKSENHSGTIILLKEVFDIDNSDLEQAKKDRVDKQYYVDFEATKSEVKDAITIAEEFNASIRANIELISSKDITEYRLRFEKYT